MEQSNIINFLLASMILLLIYKMILCKRKNEPFNIMNCRKYPYLCNDNNPNQTKNQNTSLYPSKRPNYLNDLNKISPRYNPSSRNKNNRQNNRRTRGNRGNRSNTRSDSTILTRRRFFDPQANVI